MANFFVRASNDVPVGGAQISGQPQKMPFPGWRYDAADAAAAAAAHMVAFPALRTVVGLKLLVTPEAAIETFEPSVVIAPSTLPSYT